MSESFTFDDAVMSGGAASAAAGRSPTLLTYADLIEHLVMSSSGGASDPEQRDIRAAAQRAYLDLATAHDWRYYYTQYRVYMTAAYLTGTVAYTNSTNVLTLTGGTWPAWAASGRILIGANVCAVSSRTDDSNLVLDPVVNPGADVAAGTGYILYRNTYPLPSDFRNMDSPQPQYFWSGGTYLTPDEFLRFERRLPTAGVPLHWTIMKSDTLIGGWEVRVWGYPATDQTFDLTYRRNPREMKRSGHESTSRAGTISVSASATVTGSGTAFSNDMVGGIMRISSDTTKAPEGLPGLNPYAEQIPIQAVGGASGITLTMATAGTYSATKYTIADPVDVSGGMWGALLAGAEYWLARLRNKPDAQTKYSLYRQEFRMALEKDQVAPLAGRDSRVIDTLQYTIPILADNYAGR